MRMMLRFTLPVATGNKAFSDGTLARTVESLIAKLNPESAYFAPLDGKRGGMIFFDMTDPAQNLAFAEPLFLGLDAHVQFIPVMNAEDLKRGLSSFS